MLLSKGKISSFIKLEFVVEKAQETKRSKQIILYVRRDEYNRIEVCCLRERGQGRPLWWDRSHVFCQQTCCSVLFMMRKYYFSLERKPQVK